MKPQISVHISTLPRYANIKIYDDVFVLTVTRQISNESSEYFDCLNAPEGADVIETYNSKGKEYVTCRRAFCWSDGWYPTQDKVLKLAERMHKYIMYWITKYDIMMLEYKLNNYSL